MEEYDIKIDDLFLEDEEVLSDIEIEKAIKGTINKALRTRPEDTRSPKGLEIEVPPEWTDVLGRKGKILGGYEDVGWKVMWYNLHALAGKGNLVRSWISIRDRRYVAKDK
tara:strand:+ start:600 stop:929 length:330 start_codon:yes stop_codon:yes gene_type:complete